MTIFLDTGINISESLQTLEAQQAQLVQGKRIAQMFPSGFRELPLPAGLNRHENIRGVFHYHGNRISSSIIDLLSAERRENEILNLGPYNKTDIKKFLDAGEESALDEEPKEGDSEVGNSYPVDGTFTYDNVYKST